VNVELKQTCNRCTFLGGMGRVSIVGTNALAAVRSPLLFSMYQQLSMLLPSEVKFIESIVFTRDQFGDALNCETRPAPYYSAIEEAIMCLVKQGRGRRNVIVHVSRSQRLELTKGLTQVGVNINAQQQIEPGSCDNLIIISGVSTRTWLTRLWSLPQ